MARKGNPNPSPATRFGPGNNANPKGMTSRHRELIIENAERAVAIRNRMLEVLQTRLAADKDGGLAIAAIGADILRLLKDAEDRGLGAPKASVDIQNPDGSLSNRDTLQALVVEHLKKLHAGAKPKRA